MQAISVIMPAYRAGWCLADALRSVQAQTLRPLEILVGCDACEESLAKALEIRVLLDLRMRVFEFFEHAGCYRIRNTLAALARGDVLGFFDADDKMEPRHLEIMARLAGPRTFVKAIGRVSMNGGFPLPWDQCHGVSAIRRDLFLLNGGFEPWECGADTEALDRWRRAGIEMCEPKERTLLVRKHSESLTFKGDSGYKSRARMEVRKEIRRRRLRAVTRNEIAVAWCREILATTQWSQGGA